MSKSSQLNKERERSLLYELYFNSGTHEIFSTLERILLISMSSDL